MSTNASSDRHKQTRRSVDCDPIERTATHRPARLANGRPDGCAQTQANTKKNATSAGCKHQDTMSNQPFAQIKRRPSGRRLTRENPRSSTEAAGDVVFRFLAGRFDEDLIGFTELHQLAQVHVGGVVRATRSLLQSHHDDKAGHKARTASMFAKTLACQHPFYRLLSACLLTHFLVSELFDTFYALFAEYPVTDLRQIDPIIPSMIREKGLHRLRTNCIPLPSRM